jgi:hypothetical protein
MREDAAALRNGQRAVARRSKIEQKRDIGKLGRWQCCCLKICRQKARIKITGARHETLQIRSRRCVDRRSAQCGSGAGRAGWLTAIGRRHADRRHRGSARWGLGDLKLVINLFLIFVFLEHVSVRLGRERGFERRTQL